VVLLLRPGQHLVGAGRSVGGGGQGLLRERGLAVAVPPLAAGVVAGVVARELPEPWTEAGGVAQLAQVLPGGEQHLLGHLLAGADVAHDGQADGADDVLVSLDEPGVGAAIPSLGGEDARLQCL
jgi:hypothetical protein